MSAALLAVKGTGHPAANPVRRDPELTLFDIPLQRTFVRALTISFFALAGAIIIVAFGAALRDVLSGGDFTQIIVRLVNANVIAIAVFELAMVISKEYGEDEEHCDVFVMLRRTLPRFIGTVCVALSLEGLIMVIKYSQLDLSATLYFPVAIIAAAALLLMGLGVFLKLTPESGGAPPRIDCCT